jgi:hypothetical protein
MLVEGCSCNSFGGTERIVRFIFSLRSSAVLVIIDAPLQAASDLALPGTTPSSLDAMVAGTAGVDPCRRGITKPKSSTKASFPIK